MSANVYVIEDYENETAFRPKKTNPIQTQSKPVLSAVEWANFFKGQNRLPKKPAKTTYRTSSGSFFDIVPKCL